MILEFHGVTKSVRGTPVLSDMSFALPPGLSIGILGPRGSGKTTLVNLLLGAANPDSGRILRNGRLSFPIGSPPTLNRFLTGEENVAFAARLSGLDPRPALRFVEEVSGLGDAYRKPVSTYNATRRARLIYAMGYAFPADCYVSDGALVGGDGDFRDRCLAIAKQRKAQSSFFFATRSTIDIRLFADVAGVILDRRIVFFPTKKAAIDAFLAVDRAAPAEIRTDIPDDSSDDAQIDL